MLIYNIIIYNRSIAHSTINIYRANKQKKLSLLNNTDNSTEHLNI